MNSSPAIDCAIASFFLQHQVKALDLRLKLKVEVHLSTSHIKLTIPITIEKLDKFKFFTFLELFTVFYSSLDVSANSFSWSEVQITFTMHEPRKKT